MRNCLHLTAQKFALVGTLTLPRPRGSPLTSKIVLVLDRVKSVSVSLHLEEVKGFRKPYRNIGIGTLIDEL